MACSAFRFTSQGAGGRRGRLFEDGPAGVASALGGAGGPELATGSLLRS